MLNSYSITQIYDDFVITYDWFKSLGIKDIDSSRLPDILKYLSLNKDKFANDFGTALDEATALNHIRVAFSKLNKNHLPKKGLSKCIRGSFHSYDEDPDLNTNQARDTLFELETAANFLLNGYNVIHEFDDVNMLIDQDKLSIQCKRPSSWGQLDPHFDKAVSQLINDNKIIESPSSFGMISFSLEKLYKLDSNPNNISNNKNSNQNIIRIVKDKNELNKMIDDTRKDMRDKTTPLWNTAIKKFPHIKLVGMMYMYRTTVIYKDTGVLTYKRLFLYDVPVFPPGSPLKRITDYINYKIRKN